MENSVIAKNTPAWRAQVWISFILGITLTLVGVYMLEASFWVKGYLLMGLFFTVGSCFAVAKTIRDDAEADKLINRISDAKTQKIIKEYED